jgi:acetolactate synthase-1/2/3 large subunit
MELGQAIRHSHRPLILAGGGIRAAQSIDAFRAFVRRTHLPVVNSLNAVDALPYHDPNRVGMIGSYGNRWANLAIGESDLLIVLGSRLDIRQTGNDTVAWKGDRRVFHVDCESGEINNRVVGCEKIVANLVDFFEQFAQVDTGSFESRTDWLDRIGEVRAEWPDTEEIADVAGINPNRIIHALTQATPFVGTYLSDVGQHQMWAAQSVELNENQRFLTSGGMGSMGFALPAAIGAAVSSGLPVLLFAGDGGFQCNIQELQTVVRNWLPVKIVIVNNECHGMVRQFQESYFDGRYQSTVWGYDAPNFASVATAYGIPSRTIVREDEVAEAVQWLASGEGPALLQVMVDQSANAYPKIAFGRPMTEMEPYATPIAMEST